MNWNTQKIGDICDIYQPKTISTKQMVDNGQYFVYGANGIIGKYNNYNHENSELLLTCRGNTCGSVNISVPKSWINGNAMVIRPNDDTLNIAFLKYLLIGFIDIKKVISGAAQPQITRQSLAPVKIPIPPIQQQQNIIKKLDFAFDAIEKARANIEKNIENVKELFQSKLNEIFSQKGKGWEEQILEKVCKIVNGYAFSSKDFSKENEVKAIKITNVGVKEFVFDDANNLPLSFLEKNRNVLVNEGDIVMALTRTIIAAGLKVAIVPKEYNLSLLNQRVVAIKESKQLSTQFLYYFLSSTIAKNYVLNHVNTLMQPNLSINDLKNMPISLPSIEHQQILVTTLDELSSQTNFLKEKYKHKLTNLEELKKSILEKAFKGELV